MKIEAVETTIPDVRILTPEVFSDERGFFMEAYRQDTWAEAGLPTGFVQLNHSRSAKGVLRGLHFQWEPPMGKLMRVLQGTAFLVAVDIRVGSPTLGQWVGVELDDPHRLLWAPAGFARGFCVLSESAEIEYLCTGTYNQNCEAGIQWDDPEIGIDWPLAEPTLSGNDVSAPSLAQWLEREEAANFRWEGPGK